MTDKWVTSLALIRRNLRLLHFTYGLPIVFRLNLDLRNVRSLLVKLDRLAQTVRYYLLNQMHVESQQLTRLFGNE